MRVTIHTDVGTKFTVGKLEGDYNEMVEGIRKFMGGEFSSSTFTLETKEGHIVIGRNRVVAFTVDRFDP